MVIGISPFQIVLTDVLTTCNDFYMNTDTEPAGCPIAREMNWLANMARAYDMADDTYWNQQRAEHRRGCLACVDAEVSAG